MAKEDPIAPADNPVIENRRSFDEQNVWQCYSVPMPQEVDLKLALDPRDVPGLRKRFLRESSVKHAGPRRLVSIYYDTPSFSLKRNGIVLRIRKIGRERMQSVKLDAAANGGLAQRTELESSIHSEKPDLMQIADPEVRRLIGERSADDDLVPVFSTNVMRETWLVQLGRSRIECAIDRGVIAADGKKAPVCEVGLELKSGQAARLFQFAHRLNTIVPLRVERASKAVRGYDLVRDAGFTAPMAAAVHIDPAQSVRDCFAAIAQPCVAHVLASANFASNNDDPEAVHQLRVAIRRMRAAFAIFRTAMRTNQRLQLTDQLRTLQQKLGSAREWDVLVEETFAKMPKKLRKQRSTENLVRIAQAKRAEGDKSARAALRNPHYTGILLRLASWVDGQFGPNAPPASPRNWKPDALAGPAQDFAAEVMHTCHAKVRKLGKKIRKLDAAELHRLRIRVKKLRYATEFFGSIWPKERTKHYLAALKSLQQVLGELHDVIVAEELVARLSSNEGSDAGFGNEPVNRWLIRYQRRGRKEAIELWSKFARQKPFWKGT